MEIRGEQWSARQARQCYERAASPTAFGAQARQWNAAGQRFDASAKAERAGDWGAAEREWRAATALLVGAGLSLDGPQAPGAAPEQPDGSSMIGLCGLRARALREAAENASPLQTERAVVQYGAAAALDRAASLWADGRDEEAACWMRAAEFVMETTLAPVPWRQPQRV